VVTTEELSGEVIKRQAIGGDSVPAPVPTKTAPSSSFQSQGKNVDSTDIQLGSPAEMMSSAGVLDQSPTTGLVGAKLPATIVLPTPVSSSSSSEKLDYSGDDDVECDNVHPAPDTSKYSYLAEEEMHVAIPSQNRHLERPLLLRVFFSTPIIIFFLQSSRYCLDLI